MNYTQSVKSDFLISLQGAIRDRTAKVGVIGLGYVGLPLASAVARAGFSTLGFDVDPAKIIEIAAGRSYIGAVASNELAQLVETGLFEATTAMERLSEVEVIVICVPTPLTKHREPDTSYIERTGAQIAASLRNGQVVVLESTTYPGTTTQLLRPILESTGLKSGRDFFLGFSPEREDPGNVTHRTTTIPKIVSGDGEEASAAIHDFYASIVERVVSVSSPDAAEATKLTENIFRAVNIALVNELKVVYHAMGIDIWEVIDAAATKPFGFMPFYPGPGLGGHCIPIDPFYLTWASRAYDLPTKFIELAGEINVAMPRYVVGKLEEALSDRFKKSLHGASILIIGLAYKKNISDIRESPSLKLMELIQDRGSLVDFADPHVPIITMSREHGKLAGKMAVQITPEGIARYDAIVIATDHDGIDYNALSGAQLIIDTRNAMARRDLSGSNVVKA
ncbi:nucleotide sugar dehydrogenase [Devosia sp. J2-20]|uniref:nucleotide sugar dehydrogenase n=1 Tax=Devosia sp. J2-20 TaxID=3026161 RepID=UPI00249BD06C|nr:nucleotide sugar dehydrogenase [Devosia sp. J2-20]WDQ99678.1 nucleotide sugar dehydrogenase [Devosia sp. J2-20]